MKLLTRLLLAGGAATALAAGGCEDGNNLVGGGALAPQDNFGATFATAFNADATAEPINPQPGDLPPVDLTAEPVNF